MTSATSAPPATSALGHTAVGEQFTKESATGFEGTLVADDRRFVESPAMGHLVCMERTSGMTQAGEEISGARHPRHH